LLSYMSKPKRGNGSGSERKKKSSRKILLKTILITNSITSNSISFSLSPAHSRSLTFTSITIKHQQPTATPTANGMSEN